MTTPTQSDEQRVKEVYPDALCVADYTDENYWSIVYSSEDNGEILGTGRTNDEAWADAASRLPKVEKRLCDECEGNGKMLAMCGECNGTGYAIDPSAKEAAPQMFEEIKKSARETWWITSGYKSDTGVGGAFDLGFEAGWNAAKASSPDQKVLDEIINGGYLDKYPEEKKRVVSLRTSSPSSNRRR